MNLGAADIRPRSATLLLKPQEEAIWAATTKLELEAAFDSMRLAHGDATPRANAEGALTAPTDAEGLRKWPANWGSWLAVNAQRVADHYNSLP